MSIDAILTHIDEHLPNSLDRLTELLRIPSISNDPTFAEHCQRAADWLAADLQSFGVSAQKHLTKGHPIVVGHIGETGPHLLFYGHYDVQPADPLELWTHDPFDPHIEDSPTGPVIRGRGASDDKGQLMTFVEACRAYHQVTGHLPCRITFFFEGEEESGSPSLVPFLREHAAELGADIALICDTSMVSPGVPSIVSQLRGVLEEEMVLHGPKIDLHSGDYGGPALNPLKEIARIIASFHDSTGRVAIDGFYDGVPELPAQRQREWEDCGFDEESYLALAGFTQSHGEQGYSTLIQQWARPTLEINGLWGGYQGEGSKTVIPADAHCKLTCRLVGDMDPDRLRGKIRTHVEARLPPDARLTWAKGLEGSAASSMDITRLEFEKASAALSDEWKKMAVFVGSGGSIPIAGYLKDILGLEAILVGFADDDDAIHSPNEKYGVRNFRKGIRSWVRILDKLAG